MCSRWGCTGERATVACCGDEVGWSLRQEAVGGAVSFLTFGAAVWLQVHEQPLMLAVADTEGLLETLKVSV